MCVFVCLSVMCASGMSVFWLSVSMHVCYVCLTCVFLLHVSVLCGWQCLSYVSVMFVCVCMSLMCVSVVPGCVCVLCVRCMYVHHMCLPVVSVSLCVCPSCLYVCVCV